MNIGEEIVSTYLQYVKGCEFIQNNLYLPDIQGEIDVVGVNLKKKEIYICEVAVHLITGLQYVKNNQPDNIARFVNKFSKEIEYANKYFREYKKHFMLWSPIVKNQGKNAKHNQMRDIAKIKTEIKRKHHVNIEFIINREFQNCLAILRNYAKKETKELKSPVLRLMQIEEHLNRHLS